MRGHLQESLLFSQDVNPERGRWQLKVCTWDGFSLAPQIAFRKGWANFRFKSMLAIWWGAGKMRAQIKSKVDAAKVLGQLEQIIDF